MSQVDITMPQLGETLAEGTVSRWLVDAGSRVEEGDPVLEVTTDKVDTEVVSPATGTLLRILVEVGDTVPVGTPLAQVGVGARNRVVQTAATAHATTAARPHRHRDSPRVRRAARKQGVDLASVRPTGPHGRARLEDVLASAGVSGSPSEPINQPVPARREPEHPVAPRGRVEPLSRRRRVIAERMHRSLQETAQLTTVVELDLTHVHHARLRAKDAFRARFGAGLSVLAFVAESAVRALDEHPVLQARLDMEAGTVTYPDSVGLGVAVDTPEGLVVPVIHDAGDLTVGALARRIADVATRCRDGSATVDDLSGGTFTVTNTGSRGALFDTPILNAPQSAILGLGALVRRPVVLDTDAGDEVIAVRHLAYASLTYDHRLVDGADAARYLTTLKADLESPTRSLTETLGLGETA